MSVEELVRSWKDEDYRLSMNVGYRPEHPAGDPAVEVYQTAASPDTCTDYYSCGHICTSF